MKLPRLTSFLLVCGLSGFSHAAIWTDNFDSYAAGNFTSLSGGWTEFAGAAEPVAISTDVAHSGNHSLKLIEGPSSGNGYGSDVFVNFPTLLTSGQYQFRFWQFVETGFDSTSDLFITEGLLPGAFDTGLDIATDGGNIFGGGQAIIPWQYTTTAAFIPPTTTLAAIQFGQWAEHVVNINLDADTFSYTYNGATVVANAPWNITAAAPALAGMNIWVGNEVGSNADNVVQAIYYDDFSLTAVPEPSAGLLVAIGCAAVGMRRRKR